MNYAYVTIAGVATLLIAVICFQHLHVNELDAKLSSALSEVNTFKGINEEQVKEINKQNQSIKALKDESVAATKRAQLAVNNAQKLTDAYIKASAKLDSVKLSGNSCQDAFAYVDEYYKGVK